MAHEAALLPLDSSISACSRRPTITRGQSASTSGLSYFAFDDDAPQYPQPKLGAREQYRRTVSSSSEELPSTTCEEQYQRSAATPKTVRIGMPPKALHRASSEASPIREFRAPDTHEVAHEETGRLRRRRSFSVAVRDSLGLRRASHLPSSEPSVQDMLVSTPTSTPKSTSRLRRVAQLPKRAFRAYTGTAPEKPVELSLLPQVPAAVRTKSFDVLADTPPHLTRSSSSVDREYQTRAQMPRSMSGIALRQPGQVHLKKASSVQTLREAESSTMYQVHFWRDANDIVDARRNRWPPPEQDKSYTRVGPHAHYLLGQRKLSMPQLRTDGAPMTGWPSRSSSFSRSPTYPLMLGAEQPSLPLPRDAAVTATPYSHRQPAGLGPQSDDFRPAVPGTYGDKPWCSNMGDPQTAYSPTMPQGHSKWRDVGLVSSRSYSQAYHFHDRPLTKEEKRFHEKCTRPAASRTLTAPAALPAQEYQDKNDDDNVPLSVLRNGKLRDRLQRQQSCYSLNQPPAPPTTQSFSQQNAHMLASSNKHGQPSISSVILGEPYSAFSHVSFTRREAFAPAEAGRPVAARYRACHNQSIQRSLSTSGVSSTMRGPGNRHPAVGEYGHRLRENTGYPLVSNSGLAYREADHASPALACRLKTKGSLASLDYGRIGSCGVANKNSSVASSSSIESDRSSKNGQQGSSSEDSSPGQEDICVHLGGAHRVGPECNDSHQLRTRRTSLALEVQERLDRASRICSGLLSVHEHLAPNFRMQIQACIAERAAIQEWATLFATHGSPQPHLATQRIPEEDQVGTTEHLRRMVRVLEIKVDHVRATVVRNSALESLAAIERGSEGRRSGERSSSAAKLRRGEEVQPTIAEETEPESETESMLKGLGTKRRVCTNF